MRAVADIFNDVTIILRGIKNKLEQVDGFLAITTNDVIPCLAKST